MKSYITFERIEEYKGKTQLWHVHSKNDDFCLGEIKWYGPWRQYCFYPSGSIFSRGCLKEIIEFIQKLMDERKQELRKRTIKKILEKQGLIGSPDEVGDDNTIIDYKVSKNAKKNS